MFPRSQGPRTDRPSRLISPLADTLRETSEGKNRPPSVTGSWVWTVPFKTSALQLHGADKAALPEAFGCEPGPSLRHPQCLVAPTEASGQCWNTLSSGEFLAP